VTSQRGVCEERCDVAVGVGDCGVWRMRSGKRSPGLLDRGGNGEAKTVGASGPRRWHLVEKDDQNRNWV